MNTTPHTSNIPESSRVSTGGYPNTPKGTDSRSEKHINNSEIGTSENHDFSLTQGRQTGMSLGDANEAYDDYGRRITSECEELRARVSQLVTQLDASQRYTHTVEDERDSLKDDRRNLESRLKDKDTECARLIKRQEQDMALIDDLKRQVRHLQRRGDDYKEDMHYLERQLHRERLDNRDLRDDSRSLTRVAQPVQLRAFRDYLVRLYGSTTGGFSAAVASDKLAKVSNLSAAEIADMFEYVYFRVLSLQFTNPRVGTRGQMATTWPIQCHVAH
jgi:hypothetical protein